MRHEHSILGTQLVNETAPAGRATEGAEARSPSGGSRVSRDDLEPGQILCNSCDGDPAQYLIDFEDVCDCNGRGYFVDPDYIDGDARGFDPHSEFSTMPRLRGTGRRQL